jgi:hypothetical protein
MTNDVNFNIASKIIIYTILTTKKYIWQLTNYANLILLNYIMIFLTNLLCVCWRIKLVSTYDPQAYGPTPFSPREFPRFLSIRGARGLLALNQVLI